MRSLLKYLFLVGEKQDHNFCRFLFGLLAAINTVLNEKLTEQESLFKQEYCKLCGCHPLEVSEGRNSTPWTRLIFSCQPQLTPSSFQECLKPRVQLSSGNRGLCSFCVMLSPKGDGVNASPVCVTFQTTPPVQLGSWFVPVLVSWWPEGKGLQSFPEGKKLLWLCVLSCPWAASPGQLTSLDNTGVDGVEEEMLVCPEFKHSPLHPFKKTVLLYEIQAIHAHRVIPVNTDLHGISDTDWIPI